jgi:hypothetical protein
MKTRILQLFILMLLGLGVQAQVTTSAINGLITDTKNEPMIGATVVALHVPSGTTYGAVTREDGRFNLPGLRVGGPYKITVSYVGYSESTDENVFLNLGQTFTINKQLVEDGVNIGELVITGTKNSIMNDKKTGASTNIGVTSN